MCLLHNTAIFPEAGDGDFSASLALQASPNPGSGGADLESSIEDNSLETCDLRPLSPAQPRRFGRRDRGARGTRRQNGVARKMAPQRLEKIESGPGNGMGSEAANPQDMVHGRAADRARLRLSSRKNDKVAELQKKAPNALKSLDAELKSAPAFRHPYAAANAALDGGRREIFLAAKP